MFLFLSDSHFGIGSDEEQRERREKLFACLDHYAPQIQKLFIMGDLFDFWFEWRHVILKAHFPILCKLRGLRDRGIEIYYLAGNHDFALSRFLETEIGAITDLDHFEFEAEGKRFYLSHGDGLAPADWGYRILKRIFRNRTNQQLYSWLHPDLGLSLAHRSSYTSRNHSRRRWDIDGFAYSAAAKKLADQGYDCIFFAHTHEPLLERAGRGIYVNTGDWLKYFSYATFDQGVVRLRYWDQPFLERSSWDAR
jgi:UDP-2,3-diacylglucosamine hydrolase